jgi:transposase
MWTTENRPRYNRDKLRYPSDLTDEEWALVEPLIPPAKHGGRRRWVVVREVMNGVMYVLSTGCQWRYLPKDLPPKSTVHDYLTRWNYDGTIERVHHALYVQCREVAGRQASPTACVIDSQSVKSAEKGGFGSVRPATMRARVRLDGAYHLWRKVPSGELSIDPEADEQLGRATGLVEAS